MNINPNNIDLIINFEAQYPDTGLSGSSIKWTFKRW